MVIDGKVKGALLAFKRAHFTCQKTPLFPAKRRVFQCKRASIVFCYMNFYDIKVI